MLNNTQINYKLLFEQNQNMEVSLLDQILLLFIMIASHYFIRTYFPIN
jgi:uncharacterized protein (UPF0333 family)